MIFSFNIFGFYFAVVSAVRKTEINTFVTFSMYDVGIA